MGTVPPMARPAGIRVSRQGHAKPDAAGRSASPPAETTAVAPSAGWLSGVRMRSALAAVAVVALALTAGAGLLLILLQRSLLGSVEAAASGRAVEVARAVSSDGVGGLSSDLQTSGAVGQVVQVLDSNGSVVASSTVRAGRAALSGLRPEPGVQQAAPTSRVPLLDADERYLVVARGVRRGDTSYVVLVAASVSAQRETVSTVAGYLVVGFPALLVVVGGATFLFVGRSLRPVERIRRRVAGIGAQQLNDRVPVPSSGDEIARLAATMNAMLDRLQAAHDSQRRFVADASHELRSPLATLRASLEVAVADPSGSSWADVHGVMREETERMTHLVEDLLLLAKADEKGLHLSTTDVDLDELVLAESRRLKAAGTLDVGVDVVAVRVTGDPGKLAQALRNLADNAARHAQGRVGLTLTRQGRSALVHVDDDGAGVPVIDRERIFDRFVRLDTSRERASGGSGLGLAIVKEIIAGHGGAIVVGQSPWGGARFSLSLPVPQD